nr:pro-sigmaK processing inhibitor BofA family protein [Clostridium fallax]
MSIQSLIYSLLPFIGIIILFMIFAWPIKLMIKLLVNGLLGVILLAITNYIGGYFGLGLDINIFTSLIAGFLGIPGVLLLIFFKLFL